MLLRSVVGTVVPGDHLTTGLGQEAVVEPPEEPDDPLDDAPDPLDDDAPPEPDDDDPPLSDDDEPLLSEDEVELVFSAEPDELPPPPFEPELRESVR